MKRFILCLSIILACITLPVLSQDIGQPSSSERETLTVNLPGLPAAAKPLVMTLIKAGTFFMGSPSSERNRGSDEIQHEVTLTNDFYLGTFEVTQAQWQLIMGSNPSTYSGKPNNPVVQSWNDIQGFIQKIDEMGLGQYRLPTEAEWEYACRAGTETRFYWSEDLNETMISDYAWCTSNSGSKSHEVGLKLPNPWGLFDMSGNVWEWCHDWYDRNYYASSPIVDPINQQSNSFRVIRGGSWGSGAGGARSASRDRGYPTFRYSHFGFRLGRTP